MPNQTLVLTLLFCALACAADSERAATRTDSRPKPTDNAGSLTMPANNHEPVRATSPSVANPTVGAPRMDPAPQVAPMVDGQCGAVTQTAQNTLQPVDIIFSIDTSGSMREEIASVKANMNALSQQIRDSGIDVHVIVIADVWTGMDDGFGGLIFTDGICIDAPLGSGMCPMDSNPPGYAHVIEVVGQWNILDAYLVHYPDYKQYLRPSSVKTFVSISDADALTPADQFIKSVDALDPSSNMWAQWHYSAIYAHSMCGMAEPSPVHADLVKRKGGVDADLCTQQDFAPVFDQIAASLVDVVQIACEWSIPAVPSGETFEAGKTNVKISVDGAQQMLLKTASAQACATREGWYYDDEANPTRVLACPATCSRLQSAAEASVSVLFGCATQIAPQ